MYHPNLICFSDISILASLMSSRVRGGENNDVVEDEDLPVIIGAVVADASLGPPAQLPHVAISPVVGLQNCIGNEINSVYNIVLRQIEKIADFVGSFFIL